MRKPGGEGTDDKVFTQSEYAVFTYGMTFYVASAENNATL
jgi:hypothetical protein